MSDEKSPLEILIQAAYDTELAAIEESAKAGEAKHCPGCRCFEPAKKRKPRPDFHSLSVVK